MPSPVLIVPLPINRFPNKLALKGPNNILRNSVLLTPFINKPDSSKDLTIFIISFRSSFNVINVVTPDPNFFLLIAASVSDAAAAVNPNGIKKLLANGLSTFHIKGNPAFINDSKSLPKNRPDFLFYLMQLCF